MVFRDQLYAVSLLQYERGQCDRDQMGKAPVKMLQSKTVL